MGGEWEWQESSYGMGVRTGSEGEWAGKGEVEERGFGLGEVI